MIGLHNLKPAPGSRHRKKIVGRGEGSGHGGSATRGGKGQTARSGDGKMIHFEGGQMPLVRRIPKRGFTSRSRQEYEIINLETLDKRFEPSTEVTVQKLFEMGIIKKKTLPLKVLGGGAMSKSLTIKAQAFSKSALEKIKAAGGKAEVIK
jgi:large subunit ribosomal protein L15